MKWEIFAASVVYYGPGHLSLLAELADRFNALNPQVRAPLSKESDGAASPRSDVQNALCPDHMEQRRRVFQRDEMLVACLHVHRLVG